MKHDYIAEQEAFFKLSDEMAESLEPKPERCITKETEDFIIDEIKKALIQHNYNQTHASSSLGMKRTTFLAKCKKFKLF